MAQLAMFTDYACPWCYLGHARARRALAGTGASLRVVHFPLAPEEAPGGKLMRPYLEGRGYDFDAAIARLRDLLAAEGLPYVADPDRLRGWGTARAQELALWAETQPGGEAIHDALFHAVQVDNVDVSQVDVLVDIAARVGLDPVAAREALEGGAWRGELERHWALGGQIGVRSVPTFVAGGQAVVGAQGVEAIRRLVA